MELIELYQTRDIHKGYNITAGGDGVRGLVHSPETRAKMSASHTGLVRSAEHRASLSKALTGIKRSPETRAKVSAAKTGHMVGKDNPCARAVRCIETGAVYPAIAEAARATNTRGCKISMCCQGKRHTTGGYHWEYFDAPIFDT